MEYDMVLIKVTELLKAPFFTLMLYKKGMSKAIEKLVRVKKMVSKKMPALKL